MALPLLWIGMAAVSALAVKGAADDRRLQQYKRFNHHQANKRTSNQRYKPTDNREDILLDGRAEAQAERQAKTLASLSPYESVIATYPTDLLHTEQKVKPIEGAIVCCGIGGILEHTGIWVGDNTIVELDGNGLIKPVSAQRFTQQRSGKGIFIACDSQGMPLASEVAAHRAISQIFQARDYHLFDNNCHEFVWQCFRVSTNNITTFKALSRNVADLFDRVVYWDSCDCL